MNQLISLLVGVIALGIGAVLGYYARQSIARKQFGTIEEKIQKRVSQARKETELILTEARQKATRILEAAKKEGDVLIITLTSDKWVNKGPGRPVFNQQLRLESVASVGCVDFATINDGPTAAEIIKELKPDIFIKGKEYANLEDDFTGGIIKEKEAVESIGGEIRFTDEITFSSSNMLNKFFNVYPQQAQPFLEEFRQKYPAEDIINKLKALKNIKALVIGDAIIDEYHYCYPMGKASKENVVATNFVRDESFAGGIFACANHLAGFCDNVHLITCLGAQDSKEDLIVEKLKPNITAKFFYRNDAPTTMKRRFVDPSFLSKIFEIYYFNDRDLPTSIEQKICDYLAEKIRDYDLVLVADFGHGFLSKKLRDLISREATFVALNTQTNAANIGFNPVTKYSKADYVCIDESEIRLAGQNKFGEIKDLIIDISQKINSKNFVVTRGHLGSMIHGREENKFYEIPVFTHGGIDRVGAGDAYLSITAPCALANFPMDLIGFIGNAVGALAVNIVCNRESVEPVALFKFISTLLK